MRGADGGTCAGDAARLNGVEAGLSAARPSPDPLGDVVPADPRGPAAALAARRAACASAPCMPAATPAAPAPIPNDPLPRGSRVGRPVPGEPLSPAAFCAAVLTVDARGCDVVSRSQPAGATGSVGAQVALPAADLCIGVCDVACRAGFALPVTRTGSACELRLRGATRPALQLSLVARVGASLPAADPAAPTPAAPAPPAARALTGGRQTVGRE